MINPADITNIRTGQLPHAAFNGTDNIAHEIGTDLKRGSVDELAAYISAYIGSTDGIAFLPISVTNGQTLPDTTTNEWFLAGVGTYHQGGGFADVVCTEELNVVIGNGTSWTLGVQIPITSSGGISTVTTTVTNIVSSALSSQTSAGMATWINTHSFTVATNEIKQFHVTDTGQVFELLLRGRSFGSATPAVSYIDVLDYGGPYALLASPTFTGTPSAPTATLGTNTTQLATTAFVLANASGISLSANNTWTGIQTFLATKLGLRNVADTFTSFFTNTNTASRTYTLPNRDMTVGDMTTDTTQNVTSIKTFNSTDSAISGIIMNNNYTISTKFLLELNHLASANSNSSGALILSNDNAGSATSAIQVKNGSTGFGGFLKNFSTGVGFFNENWDAGLLYQYNSRTGSTGDLIQFTKNTVLTAKVNQNGEFTIPKLTMTGVARLKNYTVSTLPTGTQGDMAYCTDLLAPTYMANAVGGGAVVWKVFYDGTSWKVG
jgi:hypothetical protein